MRRKTKIVLAITFMVVVMVAAFSYLYISQLLRQRLNNAGDVAQLLAQQIVYSAGNAVPDITSTRIDTQNERAVRSAIEGYLRTDANLNDMLDSFVGNVPIVYDAAVLDLDGRALLHSNPDLDGKVLTARPNFELLRRARFLDQVRMVYSPSAVYDVSQPLQLNGQPFGSVRVGISTVLLKSELNPALRHALVFSAVAIFLSLLPSASISRLALGPLEELSRNLDFATGGTEIDGDSEDHDEYGLVTLKIANLGRQVRDAKEIFSALKDNVDQLMANLQDGLMLFTRDSRVVLVSASVERFLGRPRGTMLGRTAHEVFSPTTPLGALLLDSFAHRRPLAQREIEASNGRRVQILVDFTRPRDLKLEEADLRRLLDEVATLAAPDAAQHGVTVVRHLPPQPLLVKADLDFMKQAILNVVINGIQAMSAGGQLTISARRDEGFVTMEIRDTGAGIPKEAQEKIFELYFTTKKDGSGIGLAQTYQIMQWHYGSVDFETAEGQGTTFRLRLPLAESSLESLREVAARSS